MDLKIRKRRKRDVTTGAVKSHQCHVAEKETEPVVVGWILDLPIHIIYDTLSRLPMKTIYSCKCVCKTFLKIIKDPYFAELHFKSPNVDHNLIFDSIVPSEISLVYIFDIENRSGSCRSLNILPFAPPRSVDGCWLTGSCNGLLLCEYMLQGSRFILYVCNPILGEFVILPYNSDDRFDIGAIGFCTKTKLYKVVQFGMNKRGCEIHTLGTNYWRIIENVPYPYFYGGKFDSSLNGNLHWITNSNSSNSYMICALNLETEQPHCISPPSHMLQYTKKRISHVGVGALDGLFCVYYLLDKAQFEVCVMKEYGVESSWTLAFTSNLMFPFLHQPKSLSPRKLFNNGDLLLGYNNYNLIYCSFRKNIFRELTLSGCGSALPHAPSFISLREIAGDMKVIQRNECSRDIRHFAYVDPNPSPLVWLDEEIMRLMEAVPRNKKKPRYKKKSRIAWNRVAAEVATHDLIHCQWKWYSLRGRTYDLDIHDLRSSWFDI